MGVRSVRWPFGRIGLHRPYSTAYSLNQTEARKSFLAINGEVKNYLLEMNIPDTVLMVMNRIPPAEIKWLTNTEKDELQFNGSDPVHDDEIESIWAKRIGISRQEYYRRVQEGNNRCILTDGHDRDKAMIAVLECRSRILEGK